MKICQLIQNILVGCTQGHIIYRS